MILSITDYKDGAFFATKKSLINQTATDTSCHSQLVKSGYYIGLFSCNYGYNCYWM